MVCFALFGRGGGGRPGGCEDQAEDAVGVLGQFLKHRQDERSSLSASRLGAAHTVPT